MEIIRLSKKMITLVSIVHGEAMKYYFFLFLTFGLASNSYGALQQWKCVGPEAKAEFSSGFRSLFMGRSNLTYKGKQFPFGLDGHIRLDHVHESILSWVARNVSVTRATIRA